MAVEKSLPHDIQKFLHDCINSVSDLEIISLLYRRKIGMTSLEVSGELRAHPVSTERQMARLKNCDLLQVNDQTYSIPESALFKLKPLMEIYEKKPVAVISFLYERPNDLESLANSFKWGKKD